MEPHIRTFATTIEEPFGQGGRTLYLQTSPELTMKKLLAAGLPRIFQIARVYRNGERSPLHHPEFTLLEWYRAGADYRALMDDCRDLLQAAAAAAGDEPGGNAIFRHGTRTCDPAGPWRRLAVAEAFAEYAGIDLLATIADADDPDPDPAALAAAARTAGVRPGADDRWEDVFFRVMLEHIEPRLGLGAPVILYDYPACLAALSRRKADDPRLAERFELYVCGIELANAYSELTDPVQQRARFSHDQTLKARLYGEHVPVDDDFLDALGHMPEAAGIALGLDRLVMLAVGATSIDDVLWAPVASPVTTAADPGNGRPEPGPQG